MAELQLRMGAGGDAVSPDLDLSWQPLQLNEENINHFWLGLSHLPLVLRDVFGGSRQGFMSVLLEPRNLFFEIGSGEGIICCLNVQPKLGCLVYPIMFDKKLRGKEIVFGEIINYLFSLLKLERIGAFVSLDCETTTRFFKRCNFLLEGRIRKAVMREKGAIDQLVLGLTREDEGF